LGNNDWKRDLAVTGDSEQNAEKVIWRNRWKECRGSNEKYRNQNATLQNDARAKRLEFWKTCKYK
jgi:hypothetical protein